MSKKIYKYILAEPITYDVPELEGVEFAAEWMTIKSGKMTFPAGYAHDGCSPKLFRVFGVFVGIPDGSRDQCEHASRAHDGMCQYRDSLVITKKQSLIVFCRMLRDAGWKYRVPYVWAVYRFGPQKWLGG